MAAFVLRATLVSTQSAEGKKGHRHVPGAQAFRRDADDFLHGGEVMGLATLVAEIAHHAFRVESVVGRKLVEARHLAESTSSARARASGSSFWKTARRVVFERGSKKAQSRAPAYFPRNAVSVSRIAVG